VRRLQKRKTLEEVMGVKAEYDLSKMKRKGHPLREKVSRGEITLTCPLDIPDKETKLAALPPTNEHL